VNTEDKNTEKKRRAMMREIRKKLNLRQSELATLAGVSQQTLARFERHKHVSTITEDRISRALVTTAMQNNPEMVKQATQPALEAADKWQQILYMEPGSEAAIELEKLSGQSLPELKAQAEKVASFLRRVSNTALSWTK